MEVRTDRDKDATAPYIYEEFKPNEYTRLIQLRPGKKSDPIECEVFKLKLDDLTRLKYDAISYVWGQNTGSASISCFGKGISISMSLDVALRHLRHTDETRVLWTDQVCINQNSIDEKDWHIPQMASIYRDAENVLIWLGAGDDQSNLAMDSLPEIIRNLEARDHKHGLILPEEQGWSDDQLDAISYLLRKPWFTRVWTLLEAAMARKCRIVCGDRNADFALLMTLNQRAQNDGLGHWKDAISQLHANAGASKPGDRYVTSHLQEIYRLRESERKDPNSTRADDLSQLLHNVRTCGSTDPRDRIYALYHFLPSEIKEVTGGKSKYGDFTAELLFTDTAAAEFVRRQKIELLSAAGLAQQNLGLPSWVPDWTFPARHHSFSILSQDCRDKGHGLMFSAGGKDPMRMISLTNDGEVLVVQAKRIGNVKSLAKPWKIVISNLKRSSSQIDKLSHIEEEMRSRQKQIQDCVEFARYHEPFDVDLDTVSACRRVFTAGMRQLGGGSSMDGPLVPVSDATIAADFEALEEIAQQFSASKKTLSIIGDTDKYQAKMQSLLRGMQETTSQNEYDALAKEFQEMSADFVSAVQASGQSVDVAGHMNHAPASAEDVTANVDKFKREVWSQQVEPVRDPLGMWGTLWDTCKARIFFVMDQKIPMAKGEKTRRRYMGLAPDMAQVGDVIAVVLGCQVPYLLRPTESYDRHEKDNGLACYRLVGECYVLGLMSGEALTMSEIDTEEIGVM